MRELDVAEQTTNFFLEWLAPELTDWEAGYHTGVFLERHFDSKKLDSRYGYTSSEALRFQLLSYCEEVFDYTDPRQGE